MQAANAQPVLAEVEPNPRINGFFDRTSDGLSELQPFLS
jgi:hypothetical protein